MPVLHGVLNGPNTATLPALLCLHGGGTSSTIFNIQTIRLQRALSTFQFIFLDAPFVSGPGPGVHPTFEGCDPYFSWTKTHPAPLTEETRALIDETIASHPTIDFVGILGFSQGARLAAGLLLEQQLGRNANGKDFKFGVFCMGGSPPMISEKWSVEEREQKLKVPIVCVVGLEDPIRDESRKLYEHCDKDCSTLMELETGHRLPLAEEATKAIAKEILRLYELTSGVAKAGVLEAAS